jgi:hypothetical protein
MAEQPKGTPPKPPGRITIREGADGPERVIDGNSLSLKFDTIKAIGLANLTDVETHSINRAFGSVSHYIKFIGDGEVRFSYNAQGEIMEFTATNAAAQVLNGDTIVLMRKLPKAGGDA